MLKEAHTCFSKNLHYDYCQLRMEAVMCLSIHRVAGRFSAKLMLFIP